MVGVLSTEWLLNQPSGGSFKEIPELKLKVLRKSPNFLQPFRRAPIPVNRRRWNAKITHHFQENWKNRNFFYLIFSSYKNFPHAKFWYDPLPVRTVDSESFKWNHNSQFWEKSKNWNSRSPLWISGPIDNLRSTVYLFPLQWSRWYILLYYSDNDQ